MKDKKDYYWKDMEPLDKSDEFFAELCGLIDRHANSPEERLRYLCALDDFREEWMESYGATGVLWGELKPLEVE